MIKVIVIEREYGSGGGGIAKMLANHLNWQFCDHSITEQIAKRLNCDVRTVEQKEERCDTAMYRLMKAFMRGSYEDQIGAKIELLDADHLADMFQEIVTDLANRGNCVIVGRGAPWFLRDRADTLKVFVYAGREEKLRRLALDGRSEADAQDLLERVDRERAAFVKRYYNKNWPERDLYDLMINSKIGNEAVLDIILHEMNILNRA